MNDNEKVLKIIKDINIDNEKLDNIELRKEEIKRLNDLINHLTKILNDTGKVKKVSHRYHEYFCAVSQKNKNPFYMVEISYKYKDCCTLKYCKDLTGHLCKYCNVSGFGVKFDYESTIDSPSIEISIKKRLD